MASKIRKSQHHPPTGESAVLRSEYSDVTINRNQREERRLQRHCRDLDLASRLVTSDLAQQQKALVRSLEKTQRIASCPATRMRAGSSEPALEIRTHWHSATTSTNAEKLRSVDKRCAQVAETAESPDNGTAHRELASKPTTSSLPTTSDKISVLFCKQRPLPGMRKGSHPVTSTSVPHPTRSLVKRYSWSDSRPPVDIDSFTRKLPMDHLLPSACRLSLRDPAEVSCNSNGAIALFDYTNGSNAQPHLGTTHCQPNVMVKDGIKKRSTAGVDASKMPPLPPNQYMDRPKAAVLSKRKSLIDLNASSSGSLH